MGPQNLHHLRLASAPSFLNASQHRATMRPGHLLLIVFLSLSSALLAAGDVPGLNAASAICAHTNYAPICEEAVHEYASSYPGITAESMLGMHVRMASSRVQTAKAAALDLMSTVPASNKMLRDTYKICVDLYDDMLRDLENGLKAAVGHDKGTASTRLSAVISYIGTCNDGFDEMKATNPLEKRNTVLRKMASNSIAISELMG